VFNRRSYFSVTPFSKGLAALFFILLPIVTFLLGQNRGIVSTKEYLNAKHQTELKRLQTSLTPVASPPLTLAIPPSWQTYGTNLIAQGISFRYPTNWEVRSSHIAGQTVLQIFPKQYLPIINQLTSGDAKKFMITLTRSASTAPTVFHLLLEYPHDMQYNSFGMYRLFLWEKYSSVEDGDVFYLDNSELQAASQDFRQKAYLFKENGELYEVISGSFLATEKQAFDRLLSSVRFIDPRIVENEAPSEQGQGDCGSRNEFIRFTTDDFSFCYPGFLRQADQSIVSQAPEGREYLFTSQASRTTFEVMPSVSVAYTKEANCTKADRIAVGTMSGIRVIEKVQNGDVCDKIARVSYILTDHTHTYSFRITDDALDDYKLMQFEKAIKTFRLREDAETSRTQNK
jgi:hypothetical protein